MIGIIMAVATVWFALALMFVLSLMLAAKKKWNP